MSIKLKIKNFSFCILAVRIFWKILRLKLKENKDFILALFKTIEWYQKFLSDSMTEAALTLAKKDIPIDCKAILRDITKHADPNWNDHK